VKDALALIDVRLVDHLIVGHTETYSFAEHGQL
jgi:DNA repair protein RadC